MRKKLSIGDMQSVGAGLTANIKIPEGPIYDKLFITGLASGVALTEANMKTHIERVELKTNGTIVVDGSATDLLDIYKYYGNSVNSGSLPLVFARPWMRQLVDEDILGFGTAGLSNINLNIKLGSGIVSPALAVHSKESGIGNRALPYLEFTARDYTVAATGVYEITDIEKSAYDLVGLHFRGVTVTKVEVTYNNNKIIDVTDLVAKQDDLENGKTWQSGYFHLNFMNTDRLLECLPMNVGQFSVKLTTTSTGTLRVIQEKVRGLKRG